MIFFHKFLLQSKKIACYTLPVMIHKRACKRNAESERGNSTNAEQGQGGESLTTEYRQTQLLSRANAPVFDAPVSNTRREVAPRLSAEPFEELYFLRAYRSGVLVFVCSQKRISTRISRESSPEWAACHGYFYVLFYSTDRARKCARRNTMIYTNDLPSNLLLAETISRLSQLGCAVTADKNATGIPARSTRAKDASKRSRQGGAHAFALVHGKTAGL
jgi:hypothetical protein